MLKARRLIEVEVCAMAARMATDGAIDAILRAGSSGKRDAYFFAQLGR